MILRDSSSLGPCQVRAAPFVSRYIFQDGGIGTGTCFGGRSFIHCFVERVERLRMFIHSDRVELLITLFETTGNLLETRTFLRWLWICCCVVFICFCFSGLRRYHTDLEQMWKKKRQNIRQIGEWMLETSCKEGLQPEGTHYHHSETVINWIRQLIWKRKDDNNKGTAFCLSFSWNFMVTFK